MSISFHALLIYKGQLHHIFSNICWRGSRTMIVQLKCLGVGWLCTRTTMLLAGALPENFKREVSIFRKPTRRDVNSRIPNLLKLVPKLIRFQIMES